MRHDEGLSEASRQLQPVERRVRGAELRAAAAALTAFAAERPRLQRDTLADSDAPNVRTHRGDLARDLVSKDPAAAPGVLPVGVQVGAADPSGAHAQQHVGRTERSVLVLFDVETGGVLGRHGLLHGHALLERTQCTRGGRLNLGRTRPRRSPRAEVASVRQPRPDVVDEVADVFDRWSRRR